ncbi:hypothetical protein C8F04DRAFT_1180374 [Mycena alexandri]|uniref:Uncharacterized protein n=1 Tax=Mycena alexandri TaxID=1745969 RepID=A0AAD6T1X1_9AGAR|nr:hypothetical protein C8F04DRAFT_1180374 [Mycena alexandri]
MFGKYPPQTFGKQNLRMAVRTREDGTLSQVGIERHDASSSEALGWVKGSGCEDEAAESSVTMSKQLARHYAPCSSQPHRENALLNTMGVVAEQSNSTQSDLVRGPDPRYITLYLRVGDLKLFGGLCGGVRYAAIRLIRPISAVITAPVAAAAG